MVRSFSDPVSQEPIPRSLSNSTTRIDRLAGVEPQASVDVLHDLATHARIQSITSSSAIEGIHADPKRVPGIVDRRSDRLTSRSEQELAGYRDALDHLLRESPGPVDVGLILHLHRLLFGPTDTPGGGFKQSDNVVAERLSDGTMAKVFTPVPAHLAPGHMTELVDRYHEAVARDSTHPLLLVAAFVLDLLTIHPFEDGNGRVARLMTTHLLIEQGYGVGRYVSIEQLTYEQRGGYYASLPQSTAGWHDSTHSLWPWANYLSDRIEEAYEQFERRTSDAHSTISKRKRVRDHVTTAAPRAFRLADLRASLPGISDQTIRIALAELRDEGAIRSTGAGRSAGWERLRSAPEPPGR